MGEAAEQRFRLERELRHAIAEGQLQLYLQPQVNAAERLVGCEVLMRWHHPVHGVITPAVFISLAEESDQHAPNKRLACRRAAEGVKAGD